MSGSARSAKPALMALAAVIPGDRCRDLAVARSPCRGRTQHLQLVGLYRREYRRQFRERSTTSRFATTLFDSNETLESKLVVGSTGYDIVFPSSNIFKRLIKAGIFQKLDKSKLTNWKNLDPFVLTNQASADPGNEYAEPYMWGTNGFTYNVAMIKERMPDAPVDSLKMLFDPEVVSKFQDCGVSLLDSPEDVYQLALAYMGKDPTSQNPDDIVAATEMLMKVRPFIKLFDSQQYLNSLPNGDMCLVMTWSGDYAVAANRAAEAGVDIELAYTIPKEGSNIWFDAMLIPSDAPNADNAHLFLNYMMRPGRDRGCHELHLLCQRQPGLAPDDPARDPGGSGDLSRMKRSRSACSPPSSGTRCAARDHAGVDPIEDRSMTGLPARSSRGRGSI